MRSSQQTAIQHVLYFLEKGYLSTFLPSERTFEDLFGEVLRDNGLQFISMLKKAASPQSSISRILFHSKPKDFDQFLELLLGGSEKRKSFSRELSRMSASLQTQLKALDISIPPGPLQQDIQIQSLSAILSNPSPSVSEKALQNIMDGVTTELLEEKVQKLSMERDAFQVQDATSKSPSPDVISETPLMDLTAGNPLLQKFRTESPPEPEEWEIIQSYLQFYLMEGRDPWWSKSSFSFQPFKRIQSALISQAQKVGKIVLKILESGPKNLSSQFEIIDRILDKFSVEELRSLYHGMVPNFSGFNDTLLMLSEAFLSRNKEYSPQASKRIAWKISLRYFLNSQISGTGYDPQSSLLFFTEQLGIVAGESIQDIQSALLEVIEDRPENQAQRFSVIKRLVQQSKQQELFTNTTTKYTEEKTQLSREVLPPKKNTQEKNVLPDQSEPGEQEKLPSETPTEGTIPPTLNDESFKDEEGIIDLRDQTKNIPSSSSLTQADTIEDGDVLEGESPEPFLDTEKTESQESFEGESEKKIQQTEKEDEPFLAEDAGSEKDFPKTEFPESGAPKEESQDVDIEKSPEIQKREESDDLEFEQGKSRQSTAQVEDSGFREEEDLREWYQAQQQEIQEKMEEPSEEYEEPFSFDQVDEVDLKYSEEDRNFFEKHENLQAFLNMLRFYLLKGALPPQPLQPTRTQFIRRVLFLIDQRPALIKEILTRSFGTESRRRWVNLVPEPQIKKLFSILLVSDEIMGEFDQLTNLMQPEGTKVRILLTEHLLFFMIQPTRKKNLVSYLRDVVRYLAKEQQMDQLEQLERIESLAKSRTGSSSSSFGKRLALVRKEIEALPDKQRLIAMNQAQQRMASKRKEDDYVYVQNAGLVFLWPYINFYFKNLGLLGEKGKFKDEEAQRKAVRMLHYLGTGQTECPEYHLPLNKILCGLPLEMPVSTELDLSDHEIEMTDQLFLAVSRAWEPIRKSDANGIRGTFLIRNGRLNFQRENWYLKVEAKGFDVLLDKLPWGMSMIRYPWMPYILYVEWR